MRKKTQKNRKRRNLIFFLIHVFLRKKTSLISLFRIKNGARRRCTKLVRGQIVLTETHISVPLELRAQVLSLPH